MPSSRVSSLSINSPVPPKLDLADAHSQLYQTPSTTSASSSLYRTISSSTRKRSRTGSSEKQRSLYDFSASAAHDGDDDLYRSSWLGRDENAAGIDYEYPNGRGELPLHFPIDASVDILSGHTNENRKRSRHEQQEGAQDNNDHNPSSASASWGRSVMDVVGKVWNFCWSGAFRGFYAGGGRGYHMPTDSAPQLDHGDGVPSSSQSTSTEKTAVDPDEAMASTSGYYFKDESTSIPGQYPDDHEIQKNWVMVQTDGPADCFSFGVEASNPAKRVHCMCGTADMSPMRRKSTAVPRVGKRTSLGGPTTPTRIPVLTPNSKKQRDSPVSAETQRFVAQMRRIEREEDASLRRLNRQLEMMIKEGKQALGARVEVDDLSMDYN